MKLQYNLLGLIIAALFLLPLTTKAQKKQELSEEDLKTWWQKDFEQDSIHGISLDRAYSELLADKKGQEIIVAVLDTKIDINHEDLKDQIWVNTDEIPDNHIDDDKNGYIDDINGWDFLGTTAGEDVVIQQTEATRIVKRYRTIYDSIAENKVPAEGKKSFLLYQKAKKLYDADVAETNATIKYMDSAVVVFRRARDTVAHMLSRTDYTKDKIDSLANSFPDLKSDLDYYSRMYSYGVTEETFAENVVRLNEYKSTVYGLYYDDRILLQDDPEVFNDVPYGDNTLVNNELAFQHSTPVSGLMAGTRDNGVGVNGISNHIRIMPVVMVAEGDEYDKEVALAIRYAVDNGADIINMSWGKYLSLHVDWVRDAFRYAQEHDVLLVSGAGNDSKDTDMVVNYPNDNIDGAEFVDNFIMAGGHTHRTDSTLISSFSNYGKNTVDIFAPASNIYAPDVNDSYKFTSGTSFASPLTAGVAALLKSYYPSLTAPELKHILMDSGTPIDMEVLLPSREESDKMVHFSELSKTGRVLNAYNALKMAEEYSNRHLNRIKKFK